MEIITSIVNAIRAVRDQLAGRITALEQTVSDHAQTLPNYDQQIVDIANRMSALEQSLAPVKDPNAIVNAL